MYYSQENALYIVKFAIAIQMVIIAVLLVATIISKMYFKYKEKSQKIKTMKLKNMISDVVLEKRPFDESVVKFAKKNIIILHDQMSQFDDEFKTVNWEKTKQNLTTSVFHPTATSYFNSKLWYKRYIATQCFKFGITDTDSASLIKLINDDVLLISLNAAEIAVDYPSQILVNEVIRVFSKGRRIQQTTFSKILTSSRQPISPYILNYLTHENDIYIKTFCYRLLTNLPPLDDVSESAYADIEQDNVDLKTAALYYLAHSKVPDIENILSKNLDNMYWQVRATAAKLLGQMKAVGAAKQLKEKLTDSQWWVRINAAQALSQLGPVGIKKLQSVNANSDRYAYEAATQTLKTMKLAQ